MIAASLKRLKVLYAGSKMARGFTLIEMLVALFLFALLSAAGVALLSTSIRSQEVVGASLDDSAALGRISSLLGQDLAQALPQGWRDRSGSPRSAMISGDGKALLTYVRAHPALAAGGPQRIILGLENGRLLRHSLRAINASEPDTSLTLATGLSAVHFRFRRKGEWRERWEPARRDALPDAIEMMLSRAGRSDIRMVYLVGAIAR